MSSAWSAWHPLSSGKDTYKDSDWTDNHEPAIYELGTQSGGRIVALYLGETDNLARRWKEYAAHGSHLGKDVLTLPAFYQSSNVLYGRFRTCACKQAAEDAEREILARTPYVWNHTNNLTVKRDIIRQLNRQYPADGDDAPSAALAAMAIGSSAKISILTVTWMQLRDLTTLTDKQTDSAWDRLQEWKNKNPGLTAAGWDDFQIPTTHVDKLKEAFVL